MVSHFMGGIVHTEKPKNLLSVGKRNSESRNKETRLEISVAALEKADPRASKSMQNLLKYT